MTLTGENQAALDAAAHLWERQTEVLLRESVIRNATGNRTRAEPEALV